MNSIADVGVFLAKKHKLGQYTFTIEPVTHPPAQPVLDGETMDNEEKASTIEVLYPQDIITQMLELYFQGPKSGGGPGKKYKAIERIKMIEEGKCHIKFELAEGVLVCVFWVCFFFFRLMFFYPEPSCIDLQHS